MAGEREKPSKLQAFLAELGSRPAPQVTFSIELTLDPTRHAPTGNTRHSYGSPLAPDEQTPVPDPAALRIVQYDNGGGFYLLYLDSDGAELTDTWHETDADAKRQAEFEFRVPPEEWPKITAVDSEASE